LASATIGVHALTSKTGLGVICQHLVSRSAVEPQELKINCTVVAASKTFL